MHITLKRKQTLNYPSGSALEYYKKTLFVIGDDINYILCLNENWEEINRINLFDFDGERIPKPDKPDLECATIINDVLYLVGSGSKSPQRDVAFFIFLSEMKVKKISTAAFYSIFRDRNLVSEMNIEGFTDCKDKLLFFNRGNTQQPNQLIVTDHNILKKQFPDKFKIIPIQIQALNGINLGISGACYDEKNDILILSASAENTDNAYDDGEIEGSVIAVVHNAYQKIQAQELCMDAVVELEKIDTALTKQKIESVCITNVENGIYSCVLVADNDNGKSELFEIELDIN
ncbi:MAG: hypothetical protein R2739_02170 [Chitinophagales bacterium]|nr:hypothetical protein [Bacteroidota bacterium]